MTRARELYPEALRTEREMPEYDDAFVPATRSGSIPVLAVTGRNLPEAWERSLLLLANEGAEIRTEYDRKDESGNFIDPPSRDCKMVLVVQNPVAEPRIHKCFPGGPADLQEYRMEVLQGIKDHWVDLNDKAKWQYTYHGRLRKYQAPGVQDITELIRDLKDGDSTFIRSGRYGPPIDQIQRMIEHLAKSPYTRRCQAITWQPWEDMDSSDPPCLQRIWCRILFDHDGEWWLNMDVDFRSRDAYKAAFMNMDAFILLMEYIAQEVGVLAGKRVHIGRYTDTSNSYHIYGKDLEQFEREFMAPMKKRDFYNEDPSKSRTANFMDWVPMLTEAIPAIEEKIRKKDEADRGEA